MRFSCFLPFAQTKLDPQKQLTEYSRLAQNHQRDGFNDGEPFSGLQNIRCGQNASEAEHPSYHHI